MVVAVAVDEMIVLNEEVFIMEDLEVVVVVVVINEVVLAIKVV